MIGVDTNVLVRACLEDSESETPIAKKLLSKLVQEKKLFISSYALLEMVWVLKIKGVEREKISKAVIVLLDTPGITIGQRESVTHAIESYIGGKADFGDYLIMAEGEFNQAHQLASFDKALLKESKKAHSPDIFLQ